MLCYQQWSKSRLLAKEQGTGETAPLLLLEGCTMSLVICPSCQQTQRRVVIANGTAKAGTAGSRGWTSQQSLFYTTNLLPITD